MVLRSYGLWLNRPYVTVKKNDYTSISKLEEVYIEPWEERVYLAGTDGNQVHPNLEEDSMDGIEVFVSDLSRAGIFELKNITKDDNIYEGLELYYI
jgi:hypothetical protein